MISQLSDLISRLKASEPTESAYHNILSSLKLPLSELEPYLHFRDQFYTRNLIERNANFELMTLCWNPGHYTPIHDHQGSEGWLYVVSGKMIEKIFHYNPDKKDADKLKEAGEVMSGPGELSHINDQKGFHSIHNVGEEQAVTLHFYAPIIEKCLYICPDSFDTKSKVLSYYSEFGTVTQNQHATC